MEFQNCNFENDVFNLVWCPERAEVYCFDVYSPKLIVFNLNAKTETIYETDKWPGKKAEFHTGGYDSVSQKIVLLMDPEEDSGGKLTYSLFDTDKKQFDFVDKELSFSGSISTGVVRTKSRQLYVYGELDEKSALEEGSQPQSCLWCYDFPTNSWSTVKVTGGSVPKFRIYPAFTIPSGNDQPFALLYGGAIYHDGTTIDWFNDWWQFHFDTCQWSRIVNHSHIPIMKYPRISFSDDQYALVVDTYLASNETTSLDAMSITVSTVPSERHEFTNDKLPRTKKMLEDPKFADVHVMLKDGSVDLHRFVLARYPSIEQMITASLTPVSAESTGLPFLLDLRSHDISLRIFKSYMVKFMYRGKPSQIKLDDLIDVIEAAKVLGLNYLHHHCFSQLVDVFVLNRRSAFNLALSILQHKTEETYTSLVMIYFQSLNSEQKAAFVEYVDKHQSHLSKEAMMQLLKWATTEATSSFESIQLDQPEQSANRELDKYYDIYLTDRENSVKVGAHKALLVVTSDYFKSLILGPFQESIQLQNNSSSATTTTATTTSEPVVDDSSNVLTLDCSAEVLKLFKAYIYGQPVRMSSPTADENLDLLFDLIRLLDQLMIDDIGSILELNMKQLTADRLFECYDLTQDTRVWKLILNTFDLEDFRLMYSKGTMKLATSVNNDMQYEDE